MEGEYAAVELARQFYTLMSRWGLEDFERLPETWTESFRGLFNGKKVNWAIAHAKRMMLRTGVAVPDEWLAVNGLVIDAGELPSDALRRELDRITKEMGVMLERLAAEEEPDEVESAMMAAYGVAAETNLDTTYSPASIGQPPDDQPKATVKELVRRKLHSNHESAGWSANQFAIAIGKSKSAVAACEPYRTLEASRKMARMEREAEAGIRRDRRRKPRNRSK